MKARARGCNPGGGPDVCTPSRIDRRIPMPRTRVIAATLWLCLGASAAAARTENQSWSRDFDVSRHPVVRIDARDAHVSVHAWKQSRVSVKVQSQGRASGLFFGHRKPVVEIEQVGNEVRV